MKTILFLLLLCSFSVNAQVSQQWVAIYNGPDNSDDNAISIAVDKQGNVYVTGYSEGTGTDYDYLTIKYNSEGVKQWDARYNGPANGEDYPRSLAIDNQGNVYVTGWSYDIGTSSDYATIKYNPEGVEQWVARYSLTAENRGDEAESIAVDKEGNIYVTGTGRNSSGNYYVTIKYNTEGDEMWVRMHDEPKWSSAYSIKTDDAGNVYVTGINTVISPVVNQDILTIKYSSEGDEQWVSRFDGPAHSAEFPNSSNSLAVDNTGNVYVAATTTYATASYGFATIKYNSAGNQEWVQYYNYGTANSVAVDSSGNVFVTGVSPGTGSGYDYATIKYNSAGVQQWVSRYNGTGNASDVAYSILTDSTGNAYVTGTSSNGYDDDYVTVKYNPEGVEMWVSRYNGPSNSDDVANSSTIDDEGNIYVTGYITGSGGYSDFATIKYVQNLELSITKPVAGDKFMAGETDTIKWSGGQTGQVIQIDYSVDNGNIYTSIDTSVLASAGYYLWEVPDTLLTTKAKIRITDTDNAAISDESHSFRIKPYVLTRLNEDSTYYAYRKDRDKFGFSNSEDDMWPKTWYSQFNYQGTDPFTGKQYPQALPGGFFAIVKSDSAWFPDWISWVNAYSVKACYKNTDPVVYSEAALLRWWSATGHWEGSCYGIAVANALVFSHRDQFYTAFPDFPFASDPIDVISDDGVKSTVNELFTYQFEKFSKANQLEGQKKTPYQTLQELKQMFIEDNTTIKSLLFINNNGAGGHAILAYGLKQDSIQNNLYYVQVYDNSYPGSNNPFTFDLSTNDGNGSWSSPDWPGWGGNKLIFLDMASDNFFNDATKKKNGSDDYKSPFIIPDDRLEIINIPNSDIEISSLITDQITGYSDNKILNEIPNSIPLMLFNGSEMPPYGYSLPTNIYRIVMNNFHSDKVNTFFFNGNKTFLYERSGAAQTQTDWLFSSEDPYLIDITNYDDEIKTFSLLSLINETTQEKLCIFRSLKTAVNDEVQIINLDSNNIKITTFLSAQHYNIELNYLTGNGIEKFICNNITLPENSSHTIIPDWENLTDSMLIVVVDLNNDHIIDDTLYFNNQYTGFGDDENSLFLPRGFSMSQNYPNPFDKTTSITYQLPVVSKVTLKVFDLMGNEVATLVNEKKPAGNHEVEFDASFLSPGIYFYKLKTDNFSLAKKMILYR